ncbi:MAG: Actin-like ATPase involved in cell division-like protein [Candidatus Berkelbacteria bacterium Licking1014_7]|uniref:Actin-like ATPase involved in cell division-like protein n=1 Tax=Candidatus Berkelbacteria bacterium Licking1014_7 TaxID=2017147 RepID=A0A554LIZ6_9BACT|nr:MAG: Actin-like ATPase involved in cell division-like protein [Candidatus Berkelbacteria bacterium Licking1014_7]
MYNEIQQGGKALMGIFDFIKGKSKYDNWAIALDIGTEFVKALIFEVKEGEALIKGVGRQRQKLSDMQSGAVTDIAGVIKNCEKALEKSASQARVLPYQVIIGIAGELVKGLSTTIAYTRPNSKQKIALEELKEIIRKVQRKSFEQARKIMAWETGHNEIDVRLVNAAIVNVKIDGYRVTNPLGFQGKEVEVTVFNAFAPIVHLGALQSVADELELDLLSVTAEPYAVARSLGEEEAVDFSAIFIDVGGGTTDIAVVRNGGVEGTKMFALGGRAFTKRIGAGLDLDFRIAEQVKLDYSAKKLPVKRFNQVKDLIEQDLQVWFSGVELTLEEFGSTDLLPSRIFLCGGGSQLPDIKNFLDKVQWSNSLPFAKNPSVKFIKPQDVARVKDETKSLHQPQDVTPVALVNLAIDLTGKESATKSMTNRIISSLNK